MLKNARKMMKILSFGTVNRQCDDKNDKND